MSSTTPRPWHINHDRPGDPISQLSISNGDARIIANVVTKESTHGLFGGSANAELIVEAVNSFDQLQARNRMLEEALKECLGQMGWTNYTDDEMREEVRLGHGKAAIILRARAALTPEQPSS